MPSGRDEHSAKTSVRLPRDTSCAALARMMTRLKLTGYDEHVVHDALLVASELVSNAYEHGEGAIDLVLELDDERVRIEVVDQGSGHASVKTQPRTVGQVGGWGLSLVDNIAENWGAFEGTTHVWAELSLTV